MNSKTIIIIGAPRSGTNMLRDVLTSLDNVATWPCDEINAIWRHGNLRFPSDEIPIEKITPNIKSYIQNSFKQIRKKYEAEYIVEKTCANSLRIPFVDSIIPDAKYVFIYRDGIDTIGSAAERWTASSDFTYLIKKIKFVPKMDLPYYGVRYCWARIYRFFSTEKRLAYWGPVLDEMQSILQRHTLNEVCALQWKRCVDKSEEAFASMPANKLVRVRYEDFVQKPLEELDRILNFIGLDVPSHLVQRAVKGVSDRSVGKGRKILGVQEVKKLEMLIADTMKRCNYL